ncbi:cytochrome c-type biogenesis protein [Citrobacter werkmanii]|uniref:cytochrome c-type biogenesis protein n=1 Tax=Citrobacter werkmanii TaxID=67827 RepID=UPI00387E5E24
MRFLLMTLLTALLSFQALAAIDTYPFKNEAQEQQFRQLTAQLRCPKCQNNSIADSNSMIAADMRKKVWQLMEQGQSNQQITDYMVARYGNFVTYEPPVTLATLILWLLPACFVLGGALVIFRLSRRPRAAQETELSPYEQARLQALLDENKRTLK